MSDSISTIQIVCSVTAGHTILGKFDKNVDSFSIYIEKLPVPIGRVS